MTDHYVMHCGSCGTALAVPATTYQNPNVHVVPCPGCPRGGVDLDHARRHGD